MKENKTKSIGEILLELSQENRNEIEATFNESLKMVCCEDINWTEFRVFEPSIEFMKKLLLSLSAEYILTICDKLNQECEPEKEVKISFVYNKHATYVYTINQNADSVLVYISLTSKRKKEIEEKATKFEK